MLTETEAIREEAWRAYNSAHFREAVQKSVTALIADPWAPWPYYLIGMSLASLDGGRGRAEGQAAAYLRRYVELEPSRFSAARQRAQSLIRQIEEKRS